MKAKLFRTLTSILPVSSRRRGKCRACGACCKLPYRCPFLRYGSDGRSRCAIYWLRPLNCRKYPRTQAESLTEDSCGFYFVDGDGEEAGTKAE